jgi:hypothetical protein
MLNLLSTPYTFTSEACACCGSQTGREVVEEATMRTSQRFYFCDSCGALHGLCYRSDSPVNFGEWDADADRVMRDGEAQFFSLALLDSSGETYSHGWFNPATGNLCQLG